MEHYYSDDNLFGGKKDGENWFTYPNLYRNVIENLNDGGHVVEVGCWKGRSACFMAVEIINSGKAIKFDCVDTWNGSKQHIEDPIYEDLDLLYDIFKRNMKPVEGYYTDYRMPSIEASKLYKDESLDFVFIDACHETESVIEDITHWLPKVKKGQVLAGHDFPDSRVVAAINHLLSIGILKFENLHSCEPFAGSDSCWYYKNI